MSVPTPPIPPRQPPEQSTPGLEQPPFVLDGGYAADGLSEAITNRETVDRLRAEFDEAQPFPHLLIKGLFKPDTLSAILPDYDELGSENWIKYDNAKELKFGSKPSIMLGQASQTYFDVIHRAKFVNFLSAITGIEALVTDPMLRGGGLHEIPAGGKFNVHVDFTRHTDTKLDNRLVFITYLNKDWQEDWGGALELWTESECVRRILPEFGQSILFMQTKNSFHGHPVPVSAPKGRTRRSIAAYFYTNGRPDVTPRERIGTTFLEERPSRLKQRIKYFLPPVVLDGARFVKRSFKPGA